MHPNALLDLTTELLKAVLKLDSPADGVVSAFFRQHRNLGARERHTLAETTYTVLRQRLLFQHFAQSGHGSLERRLAILGWQGSETMLRGALGPHEQQWLAQLRGIDCGSLAPKLRHNLPDWLAAPLQKSLGDDAFWALATSLNEAAPLDLRVNALKAKRDEVQAALAAADIAAEPTPYSPWGPGVQGYPAQIAHERDERIKRLAGKIDRVLVDAPCSGLGTLRRNPDLKWRQSPQAITELRAKQAAILASAARLLKPGGRLVYATCSLLE